MSLNPPHNKVSQIKYYLQRILMDARFGMLGRLLNEYLVAAVWKTIGSTSSVTAGKVGSQHDVNSMKPSKLRVECRAGRVASHMESPRLIADSLAIIRRHGKPSYFLTVTCNPNWPGTTLEWMVRERVTDLT